jgi:hypothetical protein
MTKTYGMLPGLGLALGLLLLAGSTQAQTTQTVPPRDDCPVGEICPPPCEPGVTCGPVIESTVTGFFLEQKPNLVCVYKCAGEQSCTEVDIDCNQRSFFQTHNYREHVPGYAWGECPKDAGTATAVCRAGAN